MRRKTFNRAEKKAYEISNRLNSVDFQVTPSMRRKVNDLAVWLAAGDKTQVRGATQAVIDLLCAAARVPAARLSLQDRAHAEFKGDKAVVTMYGLCAPDGTITLAFRTAVRRKVIAFKTFVNTLARAGRVVPHPRLLSARPRPRRTAGSLRRVGPPTSAGAGRRT